MNTKWLTNPFFMYSLSFLLVFSVYNLRWSDKYPSITLGLASFLFVTFLVSFFMAFIHEKNEMNEFRLIAVSKNRLLVLGAIYFGFMLEFAYSGGIPILGAISDSGFSYKDFTGIPTFHVLLGTFSIFYSTYLFHQYLSSEKKGLSFLIYVLSIFPNILVLNRGSIMIVLIASFVIYLMKIQRLRAKTILIIILSIAGVIYSFGIIGNVRYSVSKDDKEFILRIGGASDEFIAGNVPAEYYWGYLYIATPIGNMQNMVDKRESEFSFANVPSFFASELLPDFLSKRFVNMLGIEDELDSASRYFVLDALNAPTVYYKSYYLLGWVGVISMYLYSALIMFLYPYLVGKNSKYYLTGWGCLVTIVLLNIFSNMWYASGTVLIWPLLMNLFNRIKIYKEEDAD